MTPVATPTIQLGVMAPYDLEVVNDAGNWFGFTVGYNSNSLSRVQFGTNPLNSTPEHVDLGNLGGLLAKPTSIKIKKFSNQWYGVVSNEANQTLLLLHFGTSLAQPPTAEVIASNTSNFEGAVDFVQTGVNQFVVILSNASGGVILYSYANGFNNGITETRTVTVGGYIVDLVIIERCNDFKVLVLKFDSRTIGRLDFGPSLANAPVITNYADNFIGFAPYRFWVGGDGDFLHAIVTNIGGGIASVSIGVDFNNPTPPVVNFGTLNELSSSWNFFAIKTADRWLGFTINGGSSRLYRVLFPEPDCGVNVRSASAQNPGLIQYSQAGMKYSVLTVRKNNNSVESRTFAINVTPVVATPLAIQSPGSFCRQQDIGFQTIPPGSFGHVWTFGDGGVSNAVNPVKSYAMPGSYSVAVAATGADGCLNAAQRVIKIYDPPVSTFSLPVGLVCTNNEFLFTNNTPDGFEGNATYEWAVNGTLVATTRDLRYTFTNSGDYVIRLKTSIPGCSDEISKIVSDVGEGPAVDFNFSGKCASDPIVFTNQTLGSIAGYDWDLGGTVSTQTNPTVSFNDPGNYTAKLKATGTNGCVSEMTKPLVIYSKPTPNFSLALPPFSCSGSPSQFTDTTPVLTDSNLAAWAWSFGTGSAVSTQQNPTFTYSQAGAYNVGLTVTSDQGCANTIQKPITILQTPTVDFTNGPTCRNQPTLFTSTSNASIKSYQWTIGPNTYTVANPTHVFGSSGSSAVQLRVVGQNDCVAAVSKSVTVPAELTPEFALTNACAGQNAIFTNSTGAAGDPVQTVQWTINSQPFSGPVASVRLSNAGTYPVRLQITAQSGCQYVANRTAVINPTPRAGFTMSDDAGPAPFQVRFTNTSQGATAYLWRFNDSGGGSSAAVNPEFVFQTLGTYGVDLIASNAFNCSDQVAQQIRVVTPLPDLELLDYRVVQDPISRLFVNQIDIKNNSNYTIREAPVVLNVGVGISFREVIREEWRPGTTRTVTLQNQLQAAQPLSFACAELVLPGDLQAANNKICVPLSENTVWLAAYPNPADRFLTVPLITITKGPITLRLISGTGAVAYQKTVDQLATGLREWTIPVDTFVPGLYTLVVQSPDGERLTRVLIHR